LGILVNKEFQRLQKEIATSQNYDRLFTALGELRKTNKVCQNRRMMGQGLELGTCEQEEQGLSLMTTFGTVHGVCRIKQLHDHNKGSAQC
jgi:hypothetical protein